VLRGGVGLFYDRFDASAILTAARQNGTTQQSYYVQNPDTYPVIPPLSTLSGVQPTVYRIAPHLRSSYELDPGLTVERALGKIGSVTVNWINIRGVHQFISENVNAPLPGTYNPSVPTSGVRPLGGSQNIYQFSSDGLTRGNVVFSNFNLHPVKWFSAWGFYIVQHTNSDASAYSSSGSGAYSTFASNSYNLRQDYGPAIYNVTNRLFTGGDFNLPKGFSVGTFFIARGGRRFNITTGADNNGDTIYNDRPSFATDLTRASVVRTALGNFDTDPLPTQKLLPANYGVGPTYISLQMMVGKSFKFGPTIAPSADAPPPPLGMAAGPAPKPTPRYELGFSAEGQNVLNHVNGGVPIGVLTSPFFGKSISLESGFFNNSAANRTINLRSYFRF
jgi:hypothetical protein